VPEAHQSALHLAREQPLAHAVERKALRDPAEVEGHARRELDRAGVERDADALGSHAPPGLGKLGGRRRAVEVGRAGPQRHERTDAHVEAAAGRARELDRVRHDLQKAGRHLARSDAGTRVEPRERAVGSPAGELRLEPPRQRHQLLRHVLGVRGRGMEHDLEERPHDVAPDGDLALFGRRRAAEQQQRDEEEPRPHGSSSSSSSSSRPT
jgi:hypothetical protein